MATKVAPLDPELAALLEKHNIKPATTDPVVVAESVDPPDTVHFRAEGALYSLEYPLSRMLTRRCKECNDPFRTNYQGQAYCGNACMAEHLRKHFGIAWTPSNRVKKERWEIRVPAQVIPLQALLAMKTIVAQAEADLGYPLELPVDVKPFSLKYPYFGEREVSSVEEYRLPEPSQSDQERYREALGWPVSDKHEAPIPYASESPETPVQYEEPVEQKPVESDPFGDIFSGL